MSFLFKNLRLLDPNWKEARGGYEVLVEGDTIKEVSAKPIKASKATVYVYRYKQFVGSALSPSVWCDGTELARMENGRYFTGHPRSGKAYLQFERQTVGH